MSGALRSNPTNPDASLSGSDFTTDLSLLLPPGSAFDSETLALLNGCGECFGDLHAAAGQISEIETIPATAYEWLPDWLEDFGIPDPCTPAPATPQQSTAALLAKMAAIGGQNAEYFITVAAALGYTITISYLRPAKFGQDFGGYFFGPQYQFLWRIHNSTLVQSYQAFGGPFGQPFSTWPQNSLMCVMRSLQPAHTFLRFFPVLGEETS